MSLNGQQGHVLEQKVPQKDANTLGSDALWPASRRAFNDRSSACSVAQTDVSKQETDTEMQT